MSPRTRKLALTIHVAISVGWIGAVAAYMALDIAVATTAHAPTLRGLYLGMELIVTKVIVPLALGSLLTGLVMSLGTKWGLFRHYWVLISLVLTVIATAVLLAETRTISQFAALARSAGSDHELRRLGSTLVHSVGGMLVLLVVLVLNMYKPRGLTPYGWRKEAAQPRQSDAER